MILLLKVLRKKLQVGGYFKMGLVKFNPDIRLSEQDLDYGSDGGTCKPKVIVARHVSVSGVMPIIIQSYNIPQLDCSGVLPSFIQSVSNKITSFYYQL